MLIFSESSLKMTSCNCMTHVTNNTKSFQLEVGKYSDILSVTEWLLSEMHRVRK